MGGCFRRHDRPPTVVLAAGDDDGAAGDDLVLRSKSYDEERELIEHG